LPIKKQSLGCVYNIKLTQIQCKRVSKLVTNELFGKTDVLAYCLFVVKMTSTF